MSTDYLPIWHNDYLVDVSYGGDTYPSISHALLACRATNSELVYQLQSSTSVDTVTIIKNDFSSFLREIEEDELLSILDTLVQDKFKDIKLRKAAREQVENNVPIAYTYDTDQINTIMNRLLYKYVFNPSIDLIERGDDYAE